MKKLLVANWKENPETEEEALKLFKATAKIPRSFAARRTHGNGAEIVVCPPFVYLEPIAKEFRTLRRFDVSRRGPKGQLALGGQDIFWEKTGAYTGEIGPTMLKSLGAKYVIIGHSERRKFFNETDEMVSKKTLAALKAGLKVILCVGEPLSVRRQGFFHAKRCVRAQLEKDLRGVRQATGGKRHVIIAYEPIWAIGTGKNCPARDAVEMAKFIRSVVLAACRLPLATVLYGGSVNGKNIGDYIQYKEIGGALVGGASLDAKEFGKIIKSSSSF
jgi:triosephosphate isomerase (TIM)